MHSQEGQKAIDQAIFRNAAAFAETGKPPALAPLTAPAETIQAAISRLVAIADKKSTDYRIANNFEYPMMTTTHRADYISDKWCRVVVVEQWEGKPAETKSVYCFVALVDNQTRALGTVKRGDIHKAAGFKAPAKTARGNVFTSKIENCIDHHGPYYLR